MSDVASWVQTLSKHAMNHDGRRGADRPADTVSGVRQRGSTLMGP